MKKIISKRLKELRKEKGVTQSAVADAVHVAQNTIAGYETGVKEPSITVLVALADYYDVMVDYILGRTDF